MAFVYTAPDQINCLPCATDSSYKESSASGIALDFDQNCLANDIVYLRENAGSCYWVNSKGLGVLFCDVYCANDLSVADIHFILTNVLASVSFFDEEYVLCFARELLSKIGDVFDMESNPDNSINIRFGWKSIALLVLSSNHPAKSGIDVRIGSEDYRILC